MGEPSQSSRSAAFITWWEAQPARRHFGYSYVVGVILLLALHLGGKAIGAFPNLPWWLGIMYAVGEGVLFAGVATFATRTEIMRKARLQAAREAHPDWVDDADGGGPG